MVATSISQPLGVLAVATIFIHSVKDMYSPKLNNIPPRPPTCVDRNYGNYCIKAESKLKDKRTNNVRRIYRGYSKNMDISTKVDELCNMTQENLDADVYCTRPETTINRHLQLCDGRVEVHHVYSNKITIIK